MDNVTPRFDSVTMISNKTVDNMSVQSDCTSLLVFDHLFFSHAPNIVADQRPRSAEGFRLSMQPFDSQVKVNLGKPICDTVAV